MGQSDFITTWDGQSLWRNIKVNAASTKEASQIENIVKLVGGNQVMSGMTCQPTHLATVHQDLACRNLLLGIDWIGSMRMSRDVVFPIRWMNYPVRKVLNCQWPWEGVKTNHDVRNGPLCIIILGCWRDSNPVWSFSNQNEAHIYMYNFPMPEPVIYGAYFGLIYQAYSYRQIKRIKKNWCSYSTDKNLSRYKIRPISLSHKTV